MVLTVGETLQNGRYALDAVLGQGGFGITYRATHTYLHQDVVIKTINPYQHSSSNQQELEQRFIREAQQLARFQHPHIVRVSDFFVEAGLPFIVMDYIPGETLAELADQHPLAIEQAIHYIRQVGEALVLMHQHGLLHRDVKPHNIIRRAGTESVVLIDFGIARELTPGITQANTGLLSAGYAPIEQYLPQHRWTPATDVYALAATLYALLTGQPPVASVLRDRVPLPEIRELRPDVSAAISHALQLGMAQEAQYRPQSVVEWLHLLSVPMTRDTRTQPGLTESATVAVLPQQAQTAPQRQTATAVPPARIAPTPIRSRRSALQRRTLLWAALAAALVGIGIGLAFRLSQNDNFSAPQQESFPQRSPSPPAAAPSPETVPDESEIVPEDIPVDVAPEVPEEPAAPEVPAESELPPSDIAPLPAETVPPESLPSSAPESIPSPADQAPPEVTPIPDVAPEAPPVPLPLPTEAESSPVPSQ